jgi:predicted RNA-binding Zn ribbon-like protein
MEPAQRLPRVGGRPCLNFANTLEGERSDGRTHEPHEHLADYGRLLAWAVHAGVLERSRTTELEALARRHPDEASRVHRRALRLREAIYRVISGSLAGRVPGTGDLDLLNGEVADAMSRARLAGKPGAYRWDWRGAELDLAEVLWPVARSVAELLVSPDLERVRECPGTDCDDLFLDTSRNGSRRWCDMDVCGNRAKARRFRQRGKRRPRS